MIQALDTANTVEMASPFDRKALAPAQKNPQNTHFESIKNLSKEWIFYTTTVSACVNFVSAPIRLLDDKNPLKRIINALSMLATKIHLGIYSLSGMLTAFEQRNPYTLFSFLTEGLACCFGLSKIYLFRGLATGVDGSVTGINDRVKKTHFESFAESGKYYAETCLKIAKEFFDTPKSFFDFDNSLSGCLVSSFFMVFGAIFGMTAHEKTGGFIRDVFGAVNDYAIFKLNHPIAKKSGFFYWAGSLFDIAARVFSESIANLLEIKGVSKFTRFKDFLHEIAIALDRIGQYHLLRFFQQENAETVGVEQDKKADYSKPIAISKPVSKPLPIQQAA